MQRPLVAALTLVLTLLPVLAPAVAFEVGERVVLQAANPLGIPLHREPRSGMFGRGAEGAEGEVRETARGDRWLKVQIDAGPLTWIVEKYLAAAGEDEPARASTATRPTGVEDTAGVFASREACEDAVWAGERLGDRGEAHLRVASWNIRWFPVGDPRRPGKETDLAWLSCALAYLRPDIIALSTTPSG